MISSSSYIFDWVATSIYAPPKRKERDAFWKAIVKMGKESFRPRLCIGDCNEIGSVSEKQGGAVCSINRIENFQSTISECTLMDLKFKGNAFTWTNNQVGDACIRERIDKAMANLEWRHKFPFA